MLRTLLAFGAILIPAFGTPGAAEIARQIQETGLDPSACFRVIETDFTRGDIRIYFTSGYLIFSKPVHGNRIGAIFSTDVEGGDAEILLLPPTRGERRSLATFSQSPNFDEHFKTGLLLFTDTTADQLEAKLNEKGAKRAPEIGTLLAENWNSALRNLESSFSVRLVQDALVREPESGFFYMTVGGTTLGNIDLFYDPRAAEDTLVGQVAQRKGIDYFDIWTSFNSRARRGGEPILEMGIDNYRIDATIQADFKLKAVTRLTATFTRPAQAASFMISDKMRLTGAKVDGEPAELFQRESLRAGLMNPTGNEPFLVVSAKELEAGKPHEFEFTHEGDVIHKSGENVFFVDARGNWYPRSSFDFAKHDLTFRYPKDLQLVSTGDAIEDRTEGDVRITRRTAASPIRFAGFNLGDYKSASIARGPYRVDVFANRKLERALIPKIPPMEATPAPAPWTRRPPPNASPVIKPAPAAPDPHARLAALAEDVASAFEFMAAEFGPPPLKTLTVSPIPGDFGQGFPGLLYLSTLAYLDPSQRPPAAQTRFQQTFFSELIQAHEVAHQWWGNLVVPRTYQDGWMIEALANYSALLYIEKKKGPKPVELLLDDYREHLLVKQDNGKALESAGPITWGYRLQSSLAPGAWHSITYEKGTWVLHMLRRRMGDDRFLAMLKALIGRYQFKQFGTEDLRALAAEFGPSGQPDADFTGFFDTWIYGTGIPAIKFTYAVKGLKLTGTVSQSEVGDDFSARIPIEVQSGRGKTLYWLASSDEVVPFSITLKAPPARVGLAMHDALMVVKK